MAAPILELRRISRDFSSSGGLFGGLRKVRAVRDVSFSLPRAATLGLVGESGSGKSTLARIAARLLRPNGGNVFLRGEPLFKTEGAKPSRAFLRGLPYLLQMVFQDPYSSLNPRLKIGSSIAEPLLTMGLSAKERRERTAELLSEVGLDPADAARYPHEFSGGQRQRVALARALAPRPELVICDEPVSSLDASVQAQALNLLKDRQEALNLSYLFISHDLRVVAHMSDSIAVLYLGRIVEYGPAEELFLHPLHPYTRLLLAASRPRRNCGGLKAGHTAAPPERGCAFAPRCPEAEALCLEQEPLERLEGERRVACARA